MAAQILGRDGGRSRVTLDRRHRAETPKSGGGTAFGDFGDAGIRELSKLDIGLLDTLRSGHIRLLRREWMLELPDDDRIQRRQDLEKHVGPGHPLLSPEEAVKLVQSGRRAVGVLSYGWLSPGNPDPAGMRLRALKTALRELDHIRAVFWDFASLPQKPRVNAGEETAFKAALKVMGDLYASAVGTSVLQLKEIPERPPEWNGCVYLGDLKDGLDEKALVDEIEAAWPFQEFGKVTVKQNSVRHEFDVHEAIVVFPDHSRAEDAVASESTWPQFCSFITLYYNERPYDERGWCVANCEIRRERSLTRVCCRNQVRLRRLCQLGATDPHQ